MRTAVAPDLHLRQARRAACASQDPDARAIEQAHGRHVARAPHQTSGGARQTFRRLASVSPGLTRADELADRLPPPCRAWPPKDEGARLWKRANDLRASMTAESETDRSGWDELAETERSSCDVLAGRTGSAEAARAGATEASLLACNA
jgi:hypothetical protein